MKIDEATFEGMAWAVVCLIFFGMVALMLGGLMGASAF
jgi:predicted small integral membrane protein